MKRNVASFILSGLMVVLLTACGESAKNPEAPPETITLGGVTYSVIAEESDFGKVRTDLMGNYYLWRDIALTEAFEPIGNNSDPFTGIFEGNNKTISNLRIAKSGEDFVGLFGQIGTDGVVRNLTLVLTDGTANNPSVKGANYVGALAGEVYGKIEAVGVEGGFVKGTGDYVGGLVGYAFSGDITSSYATGSVTFTGTGSNVGGLVGAHAGGTIISSYFDRSIENNFLGTDITPSTEIIAGGREPFETSGNWDFDGDDAVWAAQEDGEWPLLAWQQSEQ